MNNLLGCRRQIFSSDRSSTILDGLFKLPTVRSVSPLTGFPTPATRASEQRTYPPKILCRTRSLSHRQWCKSMRPIPTPHQAVGDSRYFVAACGCLLLSSTVDCDFSWVSSRSFGWLECKEMLASAFDTAINLVILERIGITTEWRDGTYLVNVMHVAIVQSISRFNSSRYAVTGFSTESVSFLFYMDLSPLNSPAFFSSLLLSLSLFFFIIILFLSSILSFTDC